jgi:c(7)-type cytochrome triheme protein
MTLARLAAVLLVALCAAGAYAQSGPAAKKEERQWPTIARDGVHDPRSPAVNLLQQPRDALAPLPPDGAGNQVNWVEALRNGSILPRSSLRPETVVRLLDTDIFMDRYGSLPIVRFPHREHTQWLDCSNCHEALFKSKAGANEITMNRILQGEQCGQCHGAVAFPLTECLRCHNTPRPGSAQRAPAPGAR